ncbi:MAG: XTP/dITP diphosphatase [Sporolactobacillus sp.]
MTRLLIASNNQGKIKEIKQLLAPFHVTVVSLKDLQIEADVEETGTTLRENAALKAETLANQTKMLTLADDSGLSVDILNGAPGVYSARYSGPEKDSEKNINKLLDNLEGVPDARRTAHFSCVLALSRPDAPTHFAEGRCDGQITLERHGKSGFGYDPVFLIPEKGQTFAEMSDDAKNLISHRGRALQQLVNHWASWVGED